MFPGVDSASNRNEYQGYLLGRGKRSLTLPLSCAYCLEIWEPQPPVNLRACTGISLPYTPFSPSPVPRLMPVLLLQIFLYLTHLSLPLLFLG
jgi:hypothetical protein